MKIGFTSFTISSSPRVDHDSWLSRFFGAARCPIRARIYWRFFCCAAVVFAASLLSIAMHISWNRGNDAGLLPFWISCIFSGPAALIAFGDVRLWLVALGLEWITIAALGEFVFVKIGTTTGKRTGAGVVFFLLFFGSGFHLGGLWLVAMYS